MRLNESRLGASEPDEELNEYDELQELEDELDPDLLQERIADYDPNELAYSYHLRPPPRRQKHSPLIIVSSLLGVVLGLAIWVGLISSIGGNVSSYLGDSVATLAAPVSQGTAAAAPMSCTTVPCDTADANGPSSCALTSTDEVLQRAGIWFVVGCPGD